MFCTPENEERAFLTMSTRTGFCYLRDESKETINKDLEGIIIQKI